MDKRLFLALVVTGATTALDDFDLPPGFGGGGFGGGFGDGSNNQCPAFSCSKGYEPVQKRPLKFTSMGCSANSGLQMFSASASEDDEAIGSCCDMRNACFQTCGASKSTCMKDFYKCAHSKCNALGPGDAQDKCEQGLKLQKMMLQLGDCREYSQAQTSSCQCVTPEKVAKKREQVLSDFYKKWNPEKSDQVQKLAAKAGDSAKKFAALLTQLLGKYPNAIKKVKDPQQEYFENIMRESKESEGKAAGKEEVPQEPVVDEEPMPEADQEL